MTSNLHPYIYDIDAKIAEVSKRRASLADACRDGMDVGKERIALSGLYNEYSLYKRLQEQLPDDWSLFYNVNFEFIGEDGRKTARQLDFLLIAPGCGVFNLECKGNYKWNGTEFYVGNDPNDTAPIINQCKDAVRDIVGFLKSHNEIEGLVGNLPNGARQLSVNVGGTLAFPTSVFSFEESESISDRLVGEVLKFGTGIPVLDEFSMRDGGIVRFVRDYSKSTKGLAPQLADRIVSLLTRSATSTMKDGEKNRMPVTALTQQMDGLVGCREELLPLIVHSERQYLYVTGGAGTGKTWFAKSYVCQFARAYPEAKLLLVTFNKLLAATLRLDSDLSMLANLNIVNINRMFFESRKDPGFVGRRIAPMLPGARLDMSLVGVDLGYAMQDCLDDGVLPEAGYDCIVVDEAQDLTEGHFAFLMSLLKDRNRSRMVICAGNEQNIYAGNSGIQAGWFGPSVKFDEGNTLVLSKNLRNSKKIHEYCKKVVKDRTTRSGVSFKGPECQIVRERNVTLAGIIERLKTREGLSNRDIAVLTDRKPEILQLAPANDAPWIEIGRESDENDGANGRRGSLDELGRQIQEWRDNRGIWLSTLHAFKGLEAACVIVYLNNSNTRPSAFYVACTRARFKLIIMPNNTGIQVDKPDKLLKG